MKLINAEAFEAGMERWVPDDVGMINGEWHNLYLDDHIKGHIADEPEVDVCAMCENKLKESENK